MQPLRWERRPDGLRAPALVCAFKGWNDAGEAATSALTFMGAGFDATRFALIDPEEFVDFQSTRPSVRLVDGLSRKIEWPEFEFYEARVPRAPRDLILLSGPEPAMRWRTFCEKVIETGRVCGTSASSAPIVTTIWTPIASASSMTFSQKVRQRIAGSGPLSRIRSRGARGIRAS